MQTLRSLTIFFKKRALYSTIKELHSTIEEHYRLPREIFFDIAGPLSTRIALKHPSNLDLLTIDTFITMNHPTADVSPPYKAAPIMIYEPSSDPPPQTTTTTKMPKTQTLRKHRRMHPDPNQRTIQILLLQWRRRMLPYQRGLFPRLLYLSR